MMPTSLIPPAVPRPVELAASGTKATLRRSRRNHTYSEIVPKRADSAPLSGQVTYSTHPVTGCVATIRRFRGGHAIAPSESIRAFLVAW
jgi:hypothetical protein